uniref:thioredoxin-like 1-1, chloroplastic isoform X2 n=1 Tax=Erigeron canadensis TaxID=72917 RepID=UPI001CB8EFCB|nr:thioredoxin-like 1-1, chloroplastic isoform X2 [Erigeron canadensis]
MAKMMSNECIFSACNHGFDMKKIDKVSVGMIKLPTLSNLASSLTLRESSAGEFFGRPVTLRGQERRAGAQVAAASDAKMINGIGKSLRWWEKGLQPNMKEITGAEDLVESLSQICQLAEMNPDVQFLQVNYEDHKSMCYSLNVHVLPFFRFYRGAEGRVCSFSCTNATIKKFKDALARYKPDRCGLGPPKGLEEKELIALGANRDLSFVYTPKGLEEKELTPPPLPSLAVAGSQSKLNAPLPLPLPRSLKSTSEMKKDSKDNTLVSFGR